MSEDEIFSTNRTAMILDVSAGTLKRWYKWYEDDDFEKPKDLKLPPYTRDGRGTRFFNRQAVDDLLKFKEDLNNGKYKGCMAEFNAYYQWGEYGTKRLERKKQKESEKVE